ncbi:MAG TPA: DUF2330 domain-containing protein [Trichocoleus sp.]|jgi:hypothetical protein
MNLSVVKRFVLLFALSFVFLGFFAIPKAWAFCGFYVAKADASLYNQASQVAIARNGNRTVLTMANDYQGEVKDFAIVVPVPVVLQENQVKIGDPQIIARLDSFSAPRLVEYFDPDPCAPMFMEDRVFAPSAAVQGSAMEQRSNRALGVTVEAQFTVGEYDILILSARESGGLETWLTQNGYRLPANAQQLLRPYIRQGLKFFVAKVNLDEFATSGYQSLRPLQITYESPRFMLPIRLGMMNAQAAQDLIVYLLSPQGQAEITNYRTVKIPSDAEIPLFVQDRFSDFYKSLFETAYLREGKNVAFLEYAWDMAGCDPCSAEPLSNAELQQAGVFWLTPEMPNNVFLTRLHVRYTRDKFPEDLMFQSTQNREQFQGRYILRHAFTGAATCPAARQYQRTLRQRFEQQAQTLARLTRWNVQEIRRQLPQIQSRSLPWWQQLWTSLVDQFVNL